MSDACRSEMELKSADIGSDRRKKHAKNSVIFKLSFRDSDFHHSYSAYNQFEEPTIFDNFLIFDNFKYLVINFRLTNTTVISLQGGPKLTIGLEPISILLGL